ncbi:MAG: hypothetical protein ACK5E6_03895 [Cyanobacteriota bacterium]|jgi:hypothetical protein
MLPPFCCLGGTCQHVDGHRRHLERKQRLLRSWRDGLEQQLAAVNGALSALEQQLERDHPQENAEPTP